MTVPRRKRLSRGLPGTAALLLMAAAAGVLTGCQEGAPGEAGAEGPEPSACQEAVHWADLPAEVSETSGVASSRRSPGVFWTHNDSGGDPVIFALDSTGAVLGRVRVRGASNRDWEDLAVGPCEPGRGDSCLFIADTGDNREVRDHVVIYRVPEPDPGDSITAAAAVMAVTYPGGPRDVEALFVADQGIHLVSKGRSSAIELFRLSPPFAGTAASAPRELTRVQRLGPPPTSLSAQVTAAAHRASPVRAGSPGQEPSAANSARQGRPGAPLVAVRTYGALQLYALEADTLRRLGPSIDVSNASQLQGEGVDFLNGDRLVLTGEAGGQRPASLAAVQCPGLR